MNILNASTRSESVYEYGEWVGEKTYVDLKVDYIVVASIEVEVGYRDSETEIIAAGLTKLFSDLPSVS